MIANAMQYEYIDEIFEAPFQFEIFDFKNIYNIL